MGKFHDLNFSKIARDFCKGTGIEIGGLHARLNVEADVKVLDYLSTEELKEKYKNDRNVNLDDLWKVDIVSQAWDLSEIENNSLDFVMSSHVIEHLPNPATALEEWLRVVKTGGVVFFIVPDMRFTFDKDRKLTDVETLLEKYESKTQEVDYETYKEFAICTHGQLGQNQDIITDEYINYLYSNQENIHVHTFTEESVKKFCDSLTIPFNFKLEKIERFGMHINVVLTKNS
jgi:ubiquinone/menaquinone biosynthesis C-methylase UbiE